MSWDVMLMNIPISIKSINELPKNFTFLLGPNSEICRILAEIIPKIDLRVPTWGVLDDDQYSIEFNIGKNDPVETIMLHVRGSDQAIDVIQKICHATQWRAFDLTTGDFINFTNNPTEGLHQWRDFRNKVITSYKNEGVHKKTVI